VPSVHKYPPIAYRPPVEVRDRLRAFAGQSGKPVSAIITEAVREYLASRGDGGDAQRAPAPE